MMQIKKATNSLKITHSPISPSCITASGRAQTDSAILKTSSLRRTLIAYIKISLLICNIAVY